MPVRRSLQPAQDNRAYQTRCYQEVIPMINLFINRDDHADLRDMAMEIGLTWQRKDDASRVKRAAFGCEVLKVTWPHHRLIKRGFLDSEIRQLNELEGKLLRGTDLTINESDFVMAI
ncbi:hypothetical protein H9Q70_014448 [Fusarium xylarioides]|nr:hypothetical protein H9Q70_014448 [Fusarium xylarioides]